MILTSVTINKKFVRRYRVMRDSRVDDLPGCRPHTDKLTHRGNHATIPDPHKEQPIDESRGPTVLKPKDEDAEQAFPSDHQCAGQSENGDE